jgi:hypothetical protein
MVLGASVLVATTLATQGTSAYAATTPTAPTVQNVAGGVNSATLSWTAPASDGGSPITGYVVFLYIGFGPQGFRVFMSTATTQVIKNLTSGSTYRFKVAAINAIGIGALSKVSGPVTPTADFPGAPVIGVATGGNASASLSWTAPSSDGGSPITAYIVTPYVGYVAQKPTRFDSTATTQTVQGLANGTQYRFRVQSVNAVGSGGYSKVTSVATPLPQIPTVLSVGVAYPFGDGRALPQVNIDWGTWQDPAIGTVFEGEAGLQSRPVSSLSPMINYASSIPPSPSSYRPSACLNGVCVTGPWWRPAVSPSIINSPPSVTVSRDQQPGIHVSVATTGHMDAPVLAVQRDGRTVQLLTPQSNAFTDFGPFQSAIATYTAVACYSDCAAGSSIDDGFAQTTPRGPAAGITAPLAAFVSVTCSPTLLTVGDDTNCTAVVTGKVNQPIPTGTMKLSVDLPSDAVPVSTCTLDPTGRCSATVNIPIGSTGSRQIGAVYSGDASYIPARNGTPVTIT